MSRLDLFFLGPPRAERDGAPVRFETRKAMALLAYLAVTGGSQRRDTLVDLLWPDQGPDHARADLRRTLSDLRTSLAGDWLVTDRETMALNPHAGIWMDVSHFRRLMAERSSHGPELSAVCTTCLPLLAQAAALHHGDFLSGFSLRASPDFDDWQFLEAESLRRERSTALELLVQGHSALGQFEQALTYARQWLALDRLNETAHAQIMRLYAWLGQRPAALRQYDDCARLLQAELGVSPRQSLTDLHDSLRNGSLPRPPVAERPVLAPGGMAAVSGPPPAPAMPATVLVEEKRVVTALYVDAGATFQGARRFAPEDEAALMRRFAAATHAIVRRHGGHVARTIGDSILAVCGLARTHESDPELAIRSALALREQAAQLGLIMAAGISTGEVYAGTLDALGALGALDALAAHEDAPSSPVGRAVDVAMRLAAQAPAGQIWVAEATYRLTRHSFAFTPVRPARRVSPIAAYRVERLLAQPAKERGIEGLRAVLTGRAAELAGLTAALEQARQGHGQVVSLIGEAGVGKSRLVAELKDCASEESVSLLWLEGRCLELGMATSYAPFLDMLRAYLGWTADDDEDRRRASIMAGLRTLAEQGYLGAERIEEMAALLCRLLSLPADDAWDERLSTMSPETIRYRTLLSLRDLLAALSRRQPLVLVLEDLHWADDLSLDLVALLMDGLRQQSLLLLCAYRPERESSVRRLATIADQKCRDCYRELRLCELTEPESRQMVASLVAGAGLPPQVRDALLARTQGNPFFIEEALRSLIDAGALYREGQNWHARAGSDVLVVPDSVQAVILSRVDRLDGATKSLLQAAAVIGPVFGRRLLEEITENKEHLPRLLDELADRALIYQERSVPKVEFSFKHVLTQQAVYDNILSGRRAALHHRIAEAIESLFGDGLSNHFEQLAYHYEQGGDPDKAIDYLSKAGDKAASSFANHAALAHFTRALHLLTTQPDSRLRDRKELDVRVALVMPIIAIKAMGSTELYDNASRELELSRTLDDTTAQFRALSGLWGFYHHRGRPAQARQFAAQAMEMAQATGDARLLLQGHRGMLAVSVYAGELMRARFHAEQGLAICMPRDDRAQFFLMGYQATLGFLQASSDISWQLGYAGQAAQSSRQAVAMAHESSSPWDVATALLYRGMLHWRCRDAEHVQEDAHAVMSIATEWGMAYSAAWGQALGGWALAQQADGDEGIALIRQGADSMLALGVAAVRPMTCNMLAEAFLRAGRSSEALASADEALHDIATMGSGLQHQGESLRLKGEALLLHGDQAAEAEECFRQALFITHGQQAKAWELRAATSMARLWQKHGKRQEARSLLQDVYGWFTEGFDTADLRDAAALLNELGVSP